MKSERDFHSRMSPSAASRTMNCPGWVELYETHGGIDSSSEAAKQGTLAHHAGKVCLLTGKDASYFIKRPLPADEEHDGLAQKITREMAEHVQGYVDYVRSIAEAVASHHGPEITLVKVEKRVGALDFHPDAHGTADAIIGAYFNVLHVIDFKYGVSPVKAENNDQLLCYAAYALHTFGDFARVQLHIYQPRRERKTPYSTWVTDSRFLRHFLKRNVAAMRAADKGGAPLKAGTWCWFCPVRTTVCPIQDEKRMDYAEEFFDTEM